MTAYQNELLDRARNGDGAASQELFETITDNGLVDTRHLFSDCRWPECW